MTEEQEARPVEEILRSWLADPEVMIFCGHWGQGGVMELLPRGGATLSGARYEPPFHGLRELRVAGAAHHVHLDLGRLTHAWYVMAPSVCFGFRPSFELRLTAADAEPMASFGLGLALARPYEGRRLRTEAVERYLRRAADHAERFPGAVSLLCERAGAPGAAPAEWGAIGAMLARIGTLGGHALPQPLRHEPKSMAAVVPILA